VYVQNSRVSLMRVHSSCRTADACWPMLGSCAPVPATVAPGSVAAAPALAVAEPTPVSLPATVQHSSAWVRSIGGVPPVGYADFGSPPVDAFSGDMSSPEAFHVDELVPGAGIPATDAL
jgi:hypothetical protein